MNWIIGGILAYALILFLFVRFGKFLKDCDDEVKEMEHNTFVDRIERGIER